MDSLWSQWARLSAWMGAPDASVVLDEEHQQLFPVAGWVYLYGVFAYASYIFLFAAFGVPEMVLANVIVLGGIAVGMVLIRQGNLSMAFGLGAAMVCGHAVTATLLMGWTAAFHYQIFLGTVLITLPTIIPQSRRIVLASGSGFVYLALGLYTQWFGPTHPIEAWQARVFQVGNIAVFIMVLLILLMLYGTIMQRHQAERKEAARTLRAALDQSRAVVDHMADGVVAIDADGTVRTYNQPFVRLTHSGDGESFKLPPDVLELAKRAMADRLPVRIEMQLPNDRFGAAVASPLADSAGAVVLVRDMTREKEVDRMKTEFTSMVSHELRTPLTSVLGFAKMIRRRMEDRIIPSTDMQAPKVERAVKQVRGNIGIIIEEGERLTALINDLLDVAKMETGSMEFASLSVDLVELTERVEAATAGLFMDSEVSFVRVVPDSLPQLTGDRDRLQQVLVNLISNAHKFSTAGAVTLEAAHTGDCVRFSVTDEGPGIPSDEHEAIFERFHQVSGSERPPGTGLGLPICRQIVTAHGGSIHVESHPGEGAQFVVELPVHSAAGPS